MKQFDLRNRLPKLAKMLWVCIAWGGMTFCAYNLSVAPVNARNDAVLHNLEESNRFVLETLQYITEEANRTMASGFRNHAIAPPRRLSDPPKPPEQMEVPTLNHARLSYLWGLTAITGCVTLFMTIFFGSGIWYTFFPCSLDSSDPCEEDEDGEVARGMWTYWDPLHWKMYWVIGLGITLIIEFLLVKLRFLKPHQV